MRIMYLHKRSYEEEVDFLTRSPLSTAGPGLLLHGLTLFDPSDVVIHGGVRAYAVSVHQSDKFRLRRVSWGGCITINCYTL